MPRQSRRYPVTAVPADTAVGGGRDGRPGMFPGGPGRPLGVAETRSFPSEDAPEDAPEDTEVSLAALRAENEVLRARLARTEEELLGARRKADALFEQRFQVCALLSATGRVIELNNLAIELSGDAADLLIGRRFEEAPFFSVSDETRALVRRAVDQAIAGEPVHHQHLEIRIKGGGIGIADLTLRPVRDENGRVVLVIAGGEDVSHYKNTLDALREAQQRFQAIFNLTFGLIGLLDIDGNVVEVNDTSLIVGELTRSEVVGNPLWKAALLGTTPECHDLVRSMVRAAADGHFVRNEFAVRNVAGEPGNLDLSVKPIFDESGRVTMLIAEARDVTDLKRMEAEVRTRADELAYYGRLNTMGEMAASIAHEINQPLCAISSYAQTCVSLLSASGSPNLEEIRGALREVSVQAQRGGEIIRRMRAFVRKQEPQRRETRVNAVVREAVQFIQSDLKQKAVELQLDLAPDDPVIWADDVQIEQVLLNLMRNGIEAMDEGDVHPRRLTVRTHPEKDRMVEITVSDTGPGIQEAGQHQIFDPFYTTKPLGMGMGLSISRSIAQGHGGKLWATSSEQGGACFHVTVPVGDEAVK